jgi:predicted PurR-regulated permease PerM
VSDKTPGERTSAAPRDELTASDEPAAKSGKGPAGGGSAGDEAADGGSAAGGGGAAGGRAASGETEAADAGEPAAAATADAVPAARGLAPGDAVTTGDAAVAGQVAGGRTVAAGAGADPLTDLEQRRHEAGVDAGFPFGRPGQPLGRASPFMFGFVGALGVFTAWLLIQAVLSVRQVLMLIVVSMFLAIGLNPAVERLKRLGLRRGLAVATVFLGMLLALAGLVSAIVPPFTEQVAQFFNDVPRYRDQLLGNPRVNELLERYQIQENLNNPNSPLRRQINDAVAGFGQQLFGEIIDIGRSVLVAVFSLVTVVILTLYFLGSLPSIKTFAYRLAPRSRRARVAVLGDEILERIGGYVAGIVTVAFIAGLVSYIFLLIVGIPYALPLALIVSFTAFIPLVGATIGAVIVTTVVFFSKGVAVGTICIVFFIAYQQFENFVVHPRVMKRAVDVQPAVTIIAALVGGTLLGIVGALLAIPTAAAIALILREVVMPRQEAH